MPNYNEKHSFCDRCDAITLHERNGNLWECRARGCNAVDPARFCKGCTTCHQPCSAYGDDISRIPSPRSRLRGLDPWFPPAS